MLPKKHYGKYDFIDKNENVHLHISKDKDGTLEHSHDFYEIVLITTGHGTHTINGVVYNVMPGDVFFLIPGDIHSLASLDSDINYSWMSCIWLPPFYEIDDPILETTKKFSDEYTYDIYNLLFDMHNEYYAKKKCYLEICKLILQGVILKLLRMSEKDQEDYGAVHIKKLVKRAVNYINENFDKDIALSDVANNLRISQVYLCKLFKVQMGVGAIHYLHKLRIDKTMQLLSTTDMTMDDIYKSVGFTNIKSMYSLFKKHTGVSPGEFRKHFYLGDSKGTSSQTVD